MSKAIKSTANNLFGTVMEPFTVQQDFSADQSLINYYNNLDTSAKDTANSLMAQEGVNLAQTLANRPDYVYSVNGSDDARQQAQTATFQSYADQLLPTFQQQADDLQTRLANQGIAPGTTAYNSALSSMYGSQNASLNQAAYQSVLNGQNAYTQSLQDAINTANFSNAARSGALNEINSLLQNSLSNYDARLNAYNIQNGISTQQAQNWQQGLQNLLSVASYF